LPFGSSDSSLPTGFVFSTRFPRLCFPGQKLAPLEDLPHTHYAPLVILSFFFSSSFSDSPSMSGNSNPLSALFRVVRRVSSPFSGVMGGLNILPGFLIRQRFFFRLFSLECAAPPRVSFFDGDNLHPLCTANPTCVFLFAILGGFSYPAKPLARLPLPITVRYACWGLDYPCDASYRTHARPANFRLFLVAPMNRSANCSSPEHRFSSSRV